MFYIQREDTEVYGVKGINVKKGDDIQILHCLTTDTAFLKVMEVNEANISDGNGTWWTLDATNAQPMTPADFMAQPTLFGFRICDTNTVCDSNGQPVMEQYNYVHTTATYDNEYVGEAGLATQFLFVAKIDPNTNQPVALAQFVKIGK